MLSLSAALILLLVVGVDSPCNQTIEGEETLMETVSSENASEADAPVEDLSAAWCWRDHVVPVRIDATGSPAQHPPRKTLQLVAYHSVVSERCAQQAADADVSLDGRVWVAPLDMWRMVSFERIPDARIDLCEPVEFEWPGPSDLRVLIATADGELSSGLVLVPWSSSSVSLPLVRSTVRSVSVDAAVSSDSRSVLQIRSAADGELIAATVREPSEPHQLMPLPISEPFLFLVKADGLLPRLHKGEVVTLPARFTLEPGRTVAGSCVRPDGEALKQLEIRFTSIIDAARDIAFRRRLNAGESAVFELTGVPFSRTQIVFEAKGYVPVRLSLEAGEESRVDLGETVLQEGVRQTVYVEGFNGSRIPEAEVWVEHLGVSTVTDRDGKAELFPLPSELLISIGADAFGFAASTVATRSSPEPLAIRLEPIAIVAAEMQAMGGQRGVDLLHPRVRVTKGYEVWHEEVHGHGMVRVEVLPDVRIRMEFMAESYAPVTIDVPPLAAKEVRDLGIVTLRPGLQVTGVVVESKKGSGVEGARVWALRHNPLGPAIALLQNDTVSTTTDANGRFVLGGLEQSPLTLRVDHPKWAPASRNVFPETDTLQIDVGTVELFPGCQVSVLVDTAEPLQARIRPQGTSDTGATETTSLDDGLALFERVPPGELKVEVWRDRSRLASESLVVPEEEEDLEIEIDISGTSVTGTVLIADRPVSGGIVRLSSTAAAPMPIIVESSGVDGLFSEDLIGGPSEFATPVSATGEYSLDDVPPGQYEASYLSANVSGMTKDVAVPEAEEYWLDLAFEGGTISGTVFDDEINPVQGASVHILPNGTGSQSRRDGSFTISGLAPGRYRVLASTDESVSSEEPVDIREGEKEARVELILEDRSSSLEVSIEHPVHGPAGGAFVFLDVTSTILTATTDALGRTEVNLPPTAGATLQVASWSSGTWAMKNCARDDATCVLRLPAAPATVMISRESGECRPSLVYEGSWDLTAFFALMGVYPRVGPNAPLSLSGLPPGNYSISGCGLPESFSLRSGDQVNLQL